MRTDLLERIIRLVSHTGERHVLVDPAWPEPLVLLPLSAYELLALGKAGRGAEEPPLPEPQNRALTPESWQQPTAGDSPLKSANFFGESAPDEDRFYLEPID